MSERVVVTIEDVIQAVKEFRRAERHNERRREANAAKREAEGRTGIGPNGHRRRPLSTAEELEIVHMLADKDMTIQATATEAGVHRSTVSRVARKYKVETRTETSGRPYQTECARGHDLTVEGARLFAADGTSLGCAKCRKLRDKKAAERRAAARGEQA